MVCCLIGAFLLGLVFRAVRWTRRSVGSALGFRPRKENEATPSVPTPVYELPDYLSAPAESGARVPEPV